MSALIEALATRHRLPTVDAGTIDLFLQPAAGESEHVLLFFTGDAAQRNDTNDVAVVLPELLAAFGRRFRAAVVSRRDEDALKGQFQVMVMPSLVVTRGQTVLNVIPRIRDWSEYVEILQAALDPAAPAMQPITRPRVEITHNGKGVPE